MLILLVLSCTAPAPDRSRDTFHQSPPPEPECQSLNCISEACGVPVKCCREVGDVGQMECWFTNISGDLLMHCDSPLCSSRDDGQALYALCGTCAG